MRANRRRRRTGLAFQSSRRRRNFKIGRIAGKIAVAGVAGFRPALLGMAGQTRDVRFYRAVALAVTRFAGVEIVVDAFDEAAVRAHKSRRMRVTGVTRFARDIHDAAVILAAVQNVC